MVKNINVTENYAISIENIDVGIAVDESAINCEYTLRYTNRIRYEIGISKKEIRKSISAFILMGMSKEDNNINFKDEPITQKQLVSIVENSELSNMINNLNKKVKEINKQTDVFQLSYSKEMMSFISHVLIFKKLIDNEKQDLLRLEKEIKINNIFDLNVEWNNNYILTKEKKDEYHENIINLLYVNIHKRWQSIYEIFSENDEANFMAELRELRLMRQIKGSNLIDKKKRVKNKI